MTNNDNIELAGSSPAMRTTFPVENAGGDPNRTDFAQNSPESEPEDLKKPKSIKYRGREVAKIYRKSKGYQHYRLVYYSAGRRVMRTFKTYSEALTEGERIKADLYNGSQAAALTGAQARNALAALERLQNYFTSTGRKVTLLGAVSEYCEAAGKLHGHTLGEAVDGYLRTQANVSRKDISQAVEEFITAAEPRTKAEEGKRAQLSAKYAYNRAIMLRRFASSFPNTALEDLTKEHLDKFMAEKPVSDFSPKSRNHHRAAVRQFLAWAVRKDYLSPTHRLGEADQMQTENGNTAEIEFYEPAEFKVLLEAAQGPMRAMIAIGGLAGLRTAELLRLTWEDTHRVEGYIEVTAGKAKTRQRRLVEIVPALAQWLVEFKGLSGKIWQGHEITWQQNFCRVCDKAEYEDRPGRKVRVTRKPNGLRHSFITYHMALHSNENLTAAEAGNTPTMIHGHYKGLAKRSEAEKWFAVCREQEATK